MSESYSPPPADEHYKKRNVLREAHVLEGQNYESFRRSIESDPTTANKLRKMGRWLTARSSQRNIRQNAAAELGARRKNVAEMRLSGLKEAKQDRKNRVRQAKEDLRFAERGYRRGERRQQLKSERVSARTRLNAETAAAHRGHRGLGARVERLGNRWQARKEAKQAVAGRENEAWVRRGEFRDNLHNAKRDLRYTKNIMKEAKADDRRVLSRRSVGTSNKWSDLKKDAMESQEDRIAALKARQESNTRYRYLTGMGARADEAEIPDMSRVVSTAADTVRADIDAVEPPITERPHRIPTFKESVSDLQGMMGGDSSETVPVPTPAKPHRPKPRHPRPTPAPPENVIDFDSAKARLEARQAPSNQHRPPTVPTPPPEAV